VLINNVFRFCLESRKIKRPDEVYLSEGYPDSTKEDLNSNIDILFNFIEYFKKTIKV